MSDTVNSQAMVTVEEVQQRYITLLKAALRNSLYIRHKAPTKLDLAKMWAFKQELKYKFRKNKNLLALTLSPRDMFYTVQGNLLPAHTLGSEANVDNVQFCVEEVLNDEVPGDLLEAGVFLGGQAILMKGILDIYGVTDRKVILADSFEGLPEPDADSNMDDVIAHELLKKVGLFAAGEDVVQDNFQRYGLWDERVVFIKGWFSDSLPTAPIDKLAIMRLDADYYQSTMDALTNLYPKLSVGGWVILDDYGHPLGCRQAVHEFREANDITDPIQMADAHVGYWQRTG